MKVLKLTFEVPLGDRTALADMRNVGTAAAAFVASLKLAGFVAVASEDVVTRPGRAKAPKIEEPQPPLPFGRKEG
jgi:hypothetical protein